MSPLFLVGILVITSTTFADVKHVLEGSASPPSERNSISPHAVNHLDSSPPNGQYWWMDSNSPFKAAYDDYKKCTSKGNCVRQPTSQTPAAPQPQSQPQPFRPQDKPSLNIKQNPFFNGNFDPSSGNANYNTDAPKIDVKKNPFFSGSVLTAGNGAPVVKDQNGFLGVQPAQPFGKKPGFATNHPAYGKDKPGFGQLQKHSNLLNVTVECKGAGFACIDKSQCLNGVVNKNGEGLLQVRSDVRYCHEDTEVCCQMNDLNEISAGKSSAASTIKFAGGAGFSPGLIHVQPLDVKPDIIFAGEHGHHSSATSKTIRDTSFSPNSVFSSTVDYSDTKFDDDVRLAGDFQGPGYLPPVAPTPAPRPFETRPPNVNTQYVPSKPSPPKYVPPSPTTPRPTPPPFSHSPSTPRPVPSYAPPTFKPAPPVTFRPAPAPTTSREYLPPRVSSPRPTTTNQYVSPQKPYQPTTQKPYQPSFTPQKPYQPSVTPQKPYQPSFTTQKPYQPSFTPQQPCQPGFSPQGGSQSGFPSQQACKPNVTPQKPYQPSFPTQKPYQPSVSTQKPYQPSFTPQQPCQPGFSLQGGSQSGFPSQQSCQPNVTPQKPYQPSFPTQKPYQPSVTTQKPYQPSFTPQETCAPGFSLQGGGSQSGFPSQQSCQPNVTPQKPYQPSFPTQKPYQPSFPTQKPYQPSVTTQKPYQPSFTPQQTCPPGFSPQGGSQSGFPSQQACKPNVTPQKPYQPSFTTQKPYQPSFTPQQPCQPGQSGVTSQGGYQSGFPSQPCQPSVTPQKPYQPSVTTQKPYQPSFSTQKPYQPSFTPQQPYQPSVKPYQPTFTPQQPYQPSITPQKPYQPQPTTSRPYQPTTNREYLPPKTPPRFVPQPSSPRPNPFITQPTTPRRPPPPPPPPTRPPPPPPTRPPPPPPTRRPPPPPPPPTRPPQYTRPAPPRPQPSGPPAGGYRYPTPNPPFHETRPTPSQFRPTPSIPQFSTPSPQPRPTPPPQPRPTFPPQPRPTPPQPRPQETCPPGFSLQGGSQSGFPSQQSCQPNVTPQKPYQPSFPTQKPYQPNFPTQKPYQPSSPPVTNGYQYPSPSPRPNPFIPQQSTPRPGPSYTNPQYISPSTNYIQPSTPSRPYQPSTTQRPFVVTSPNTPAPNPSGGYVYPKPTPSFEYPSPPSPRPDFSGSNVNNQYIPPPTKRPYENPDQNVDAANVDGTVVRLTSPRTPPFQGELNTAPPPGCAAALKCVQEIYCTAEGVISPVPVVLTKEQELAKVPTTVCQDTESGIIGKCCRDPNYKDPWPSANLVDGVDDGQYKEDDGLGKYQQDLQRNVRSDKGAQTNSNFQTAPPSTCGERHPNTNPRGNGPLDVNFAEIPWQAMVLRDSNRSLLCGGVIIRRDAVLTAAHCVEGLETSDILIKGGEWKLGIDEEPLPFQIVKVAAVVKHPLHQTGSFVNDLALLILEEKLRPAKNVGTLCLPPPNQIPTQNCIATGWGKKILQLHAKGAIMHAIDVKIMDNKQCQNTLASTFQHAVSNYSPNTLCGYSDRDQCRVDYGSALACSDGQQYTLSGIYAWDTGCKQQGQIGGYIAPDVEWIESTLSKSANKLKQY